MDGLPKLREISAKIFIDHCKDKFGWSNLSSDMIMDVGCGEEGFCGKAILEKFPEVRAIISIDKSPYVARIFKQRTAMECAIADIESRESLRHYEGRMTKVISTHVFHQFTDKEEAFRNVYHLLKPGGEAAVLFVVKSSIDEWYKEMLKEPKWKEVYQKDNIEDLYKSGLGADHYKEMVEKIGFQVVECIEEKRVIPYPSDQLCKEILYNMCGKYFRVPSELLEEFKEECLQALLKLSARDAEGRPCYRSMELSLLISKPTESSGSKTKAKLGS